MKNLTKSFILLVALSSMQQIISMSETTTDSRPPMPTKNIRIAGLKPNESGLYDSDNKTALLFNDTENVTVYKDVVTRPKAGPFLKTHKDAVAFATMPNPLFPGKQIPGGYTKNITLYGVPSKTTTDEETAHPKSMLGAHGGGIFRGITIYGFNLSQKGLYDRQTKIAHIDGTRYRVTVEYTPLYAATTPLQVPNAKLFAYIDDNPAVTQKAGGANTKTYLYGIATDSDIIA